MEKSAGGKRILARTEHGTLTTAILPFALLQASVLLVFTTHFSWVGVAVCAASYALRMFAITGFYHRYFSHRTYSMGRPMQFVAALIGATATQKGPLWWAAHHRKHHKESDTEDDPHNSHEGFWHSHWMWFLYEESSETEYERVPELAIYPELRFIDRFWYAPPVLLGVGLFMVGGWHWVVWGYFVSTFLLSNATYTINSLMHYWGKQQFYTGDESRNHLLLALITLGEGWHNNHHRYQASTRNGFFWYEIDITYYALRGLRLLGLVRELTPVPAKIMDEARLNLQLRRQAVSSGRPYIPRRLRRADIQALLGSEDGGAGAESAPRMREEMQRLSAQLGERHQKLCEEVRMLSGQIAECRRQLGREVQELADQGAERGRQLRVELHSLGEQISERGRQLRVELQGMSEQVSERGRQLRVELHSLGEQVSERSRQLRLEAQSLSEQASEALRHVRLDIQSLSEQVAETAQKLHAELQGLGDQVSERGRQLRLEAQSLSEQVAETAQKLHAELQGLGDQVAEKGRQLRAELEGLGGVAPGTA